jgi:membrane fusion protein, macrolide-specific efflux system
VRITNRWFITAVVAVVLVAAGCAWYLTRPAPRPQYLTAPVVLRDIESSVSAVGTIRAGTLVSVGAQVSGQIRSLHVVLGQHVRKDQLIAEIDSLPQVNALHAAQMQLAEFEAQLRGSEATLAQARLALVRQRDLFSHDSAARQDLEAAEAGFVVDQSTVESLRAQVSAARISVDTARVNLGYTQIRAPGDGVVVAILAVEGQTVNANQTTPNIVKIANLDNVTIKAQISEADVVHLKPGLPAYFTILGEPDRRFHATLRAIEPAPDSINTDTSTPTTSSTSTNTAVYYNGLLDVPNREGLLRISMTAQVNIVLAHVPHAVVIPVSALLPGSHGKFAIVRLLAADGRATIRRVHLGIDDNTSVQVLDGLKPGERVILAEATLTGAAPTPLVRAR